MSASSRRVAGLLTALFFLLSLSSFACTRTVSASERPTGAVAAPGTIGAETLITRLDSLKAGGLTRQYEVLGNGQPMTKSAPVIIMLAGIRATLTQEIPRDDLYPYATAGLAEVVYPVAIGESWNAIGCCSYAAAHNINDLAFLKALVAKLDPGHTRPIYLVGYSNGARLAYRVACTTPAEFDAFAMVKGGPVPGCVVKKPTSIEQLASLDDPEVPYQPGVKGKEKTPVTTEVAQLHATDKCPVKGVVQHSKDLTLTTWATCARGTRLALAVWPDGAHAFPRPPNNVPAAAQVIWAFFTKSPIRALSA